MPNPKYHAFICNGTKLNGQQDGVCNLKGGTDIFNKFNELVSKYNLSQEVLINSCGCFRCKITKKGPNMVVYPEGIWYCGVSVDDVEEIVQSHFIEGKKVDRLLLD